MTDSQEFNAASVDEAVEKAAKQFGSTKEELTYEVLDEGSSGFLGMGSRDARISATPVTPTEETSGATEIETTGQEVTEEHSEPPPIVSTSTMQTQEASPEPPEESHPAVPEDLLNDVEEYVSHSIEAMGLDARIDVYDTEGYVAVDVTSAEAGLFIGQKGETIDAFQYLLNVAIYRDRSYVKRIVVDSEGYRQRRVEAVQGIAHRMARKAVREGRLVELPPMNTSERRIVHMFLKDNERVSTASRGTGDGRRVTVSPSL